MADRTAKPLEGISVLIVDDNQDARDLLRSTLAYHGALTFTAADGRAALEDLARMRVDVIVSDISMPGFTGHDLIRTIRNLPDQRGPNTPAIALTAFTEPRQRELALAAGFQAYMLKPVDAKDLIREIARLVPTWDDDDARLIARAITRQSVCVACIVARTGVPMGHIHGILATLAQTLIVARDVRICADCLLTREVIRLA